MVRVFAGGDRDERDRFRTELVERFLIPLDLTLTCSTDNHPLSRNQDNVFVFVMSHALHSLWVKICCVSFLGMK